MSIGDIILLVAYAVGTLITIIFQGEKIRSLRTQINSQNNIMTNMQRFMSIFRLEDVEKYVEINRKSMEKEKEDAIKQVEQEIKLQANDAMNIIRKEYEALLDLSIKIIRTSSYLPNLSKYLAEMSDNVQSKTALMKTYDESQRSLANSSNDMLMAMLAHQISTEAFWQSTKPAALRKLGK